MSHDALSTRGCRSGGRGPPVPGASSAPRASDPGQVGSAHCQVCVRLATPWRALVFLVQTRGARCGAQGPQGLGVTRCPDQDQSWTGPCSCAAPPTQPPCFCSRSRGPPPPSVGAPACSLSPREDGGPLRPSWQTRRAVGSQLHSHCGPGRGRRGGGSACSSRSHRPHGERVSGSWAALHLPAPWEVPGLEGLARAGLS